MKVKKLLITLIALIIALSLAIISNAQKRKVQTTKKTFVSQKGNLSIEVGLVFTTGDVKPVARVEFYLLDTNAEDILKEADGESKDLRSITLDLNYPIFETGGIQKTKTIIKPHIVSSATTDFQEKAKFPAIQSR